MILDFFVFWCLVVTDFCYTFPRLAFAAKAKGSSCSGVVSWRGARGVLGLHPSHILICLLLAPLVGQKKTSENTKAFPLPSYSCSYPSHHSKWSFHLTDRCVQGVKWCREAHKAQTCFSGHRGAGGIFCVCEGAKLQGQLSGPVDTKRMWEAGMRFQQKAASYLAEFFSWVTFWGD